jgi:hypothetical protein
LSSSQKTVAGIIGALLFSLAPVWIVHFLPTDTLPRPPIHIEMGKVRPPLEYRIVSFHRGRADKQLIRLAAQLGFNGVQFQIEGSTLDGIKDFAKRDAQEHLVDFCHSLGMKVTIWVHELSDLPAPSLPEWLGPVTVDNPALWATLDDRYETMLRDTIPNVDGLCLTVVETQIRATDTAVMLKLVNLLQTKCSKYNKTLMVRTFVWYRNEFDNVMAAVNQFPKDMVVMSKCVPQDWNLRGIFASEIGAVGGRPQIIEYDVAGEYFRRNFVANCMPELLKKNFDYGLDHHVSGICVRVDREDDNVLEQPNELNLWTLAMLADGATNNLDEIWNAWATNRYGAAAASGVIAALKPTGAVVEEMLSIGPFMYGDTRYFPLLGDEDIFGQHHQNFWWDEKFEPIHQRAEIGNREFTEKVGAGKLAATGLAEQCLLNLEKVKDQLAPQDYAILHTRLLTNKVQLQFRAPMVMAVMHYRRLYYSNSDAERKEMDLAMQRDLAQVRAAVEPIYPMPQQIDWLGRKWNVGVPDDVPRAQIFAWAYAMDLLRQGIDPRPAAGQRAWRNLGS